ncbi:MAG TPA: TetR/AcrR family transcriptional regulator [Leptospiraceae bacterium]|jgi:AcrR family transcriptional regulator|nr:TetR/AcrR family transcriptional regulator [Leptospirales bacterium]HMW58103.1 TetR/AcrR family transcriptional regulator [Leptospiraceae bacterium]HMX58928.1 TetR/AcrR family transcriptional regulator [Leptospiraceae bacterium]HMZ38299.1 TetR/AcrR family transcriptional regulator [Leptospiraceae bacterium]HNJ33986.1 TetR/AcrR family transcriptional regulator [Leptospiraceae bacterium]
MARKENASVIQTASAKRPPLTKKLILDAALKIIETEGMEKLSMRRIAALLDCSVAGPYVYFTNQEEILKALIDDGEARLTAELKAAVQTKVDIFDKIFILMQTYKSFASANRELHKLMFAMGGRGKSFSLISPSYRVYFETVRQGAKNGAIRCDRAGYHAIARAMWSWGYGLVVLELARHPETKKSEIDPIAEGMELFKKLLQP